MRNRGHEEARLTMLAIKAKCDGTKIMLPRAEKFPVGPVIVVFAEGVGDRDEERRAWMQVQEESFAKAWDNEDDAIYDTL